MHFFKTLHYRAQTPKQLPFLDLTDRFIGADAEYILNYTSNVLKITKDGKCYFFKEARVRQGSLKDRIFEGVECFFREIASAPELKKKTLEALKDKRRFKRLIGMGNKDAKGDRFNRYLNSGDESCLGLPTPEDDEEKAILRRLVFYVYGEIEAWLYNVNIKPGRLETYSAIRALGTGELAAMLGLDTLIPRSDFVRIDVLGRVRYGILSDEAPGDTLIATPFKERARCVTPALLRDLTSLNLLDTLTGEDDHRIGNYHVVKNELGEYTSLCSFDNDGPDTFKPSASVKRANVIGCSAFIGRDGRVNRAHLDGDVASLLLSIKRSDLAERLPYLGGLQRHFLWSRICTVKRAIERTVRSRSDFLISGGEWRREHLKEDVNAKYGKTYLASLLSDCYFESGFHDFDTL